MLPLHHQGATLNVCGAFGIGQGVVGLGAFADANGFFRSIATMAVF